MITIGIGGAHSSSGKTTLAVRLLQRFASSENHDRKGLLNTLQWGALKYTRSNIYCSFTEDPEIISREDKDTARMLSAGAAQVVWLQSPPERLDEVMPMAMDALSSLEGLIVEGNSAIEFLKPDIVVFLGPLSEKSLKPSAARLLSRSDIVILRPGGAFIAGIPSNAVVLSGEIEYIDIQEITDVMEDLLIAKKMETELFSAAKDGKITCNEARKIAETLSLPYQLIGQKANEMRIKIINCELGCFR